MVDGRVWALQRSVFQQIMVSSILQWTINKISTMLQVSSGLKKMEHQMNFLKVALLHSSFVHWLRCICFKHGTTGQVVPLLSSLPHTALCKMVDVLEQEQVSHHCTTLFYTILYWAVHCRPVHYPGGNLWRHILHPCPGHGQGHQADPGNIQHQPGPFCNLHSVICRQFAL